MLSVHINNIGKKFGSEWIFRKLSYEIKAGERLVILGGNGSGKSTLLQIISGFVTANEGSITYSLSDTKEQIQTEDVYRKISFASPYLQLTEDFTLEECIEHVSLYKPFVNRLPAKNVMEIIELTQAKNKFIRQFSSGMKQRLKLGLAFLSDSPLLLLDEPASNLDKDAIEWYKQMVQAYSFDRTIIVCSNNIDHEFFFCHRHLNVMDFKTKASGK